MYGTTTYVIGSVIAISLLSFVGVFTLSLKEDKLKSILLYLVSFSVGALFGDSFIHLIPHAVHEHGFHMETSIALLSGIVVFFILEKFVSWRHCHIPTSKKHPHPLGTMNLIGDGLHNLIDGMVIAGSYMASIPLGIATTLAVAFHEIPQEIGDFGVLLHSGMEKWKALKFNFLSALMAVLGALIALKLGEVEEFMHGILPFTAGGFIYIAGSDLIPELKKDVKLNRSAMQLVCILAGILVMYALTFVEVGH